LCWFTLPPHQSGPFRHDIEWVIPLYPRLYNLVILKPHITPPLLDFLLPYDFTFFLPSVLRRMDFHTPLLCARGRPAPPKRVGVYLDLPPPKSTFPQLSCSRIPTFRIGHVFYPVLFPQTFYFLFDEMPPPPPFSYRLFSSGDLFSDCLRRGEP